MSRSVFAAKPLNPSSARKAKSVASAAAGSAKGAARKRPAVPATKDPHPKQAKPGLS